MTALEKSPKQALNPAFLKQPSERKEIELFKTEFSVLLDRIDPNEHEEFHKNLIKDFLNSVYYKDKHYINTKGTTDLVIHNNNDSASFVGVLIEVKRPENKTEMVSRENLNVKSFQELVLYYLRERKTGKNFELRYLIITNIYEWFVFDAQNFEKLFYQNKILLNRFEQFQAGQLSGTGTDFFYKEIASPEIQKLQSEIPYTHFDIRNYENILRNSDKDDDRKLITLYKFLSPVHLLKLPFANDNNQLNKEFYTELLHIIGLEEIKQDNKKLIVRKKENERDSGSIVENAIERIDVKNKLDNLHAEQFGATKDEQLFGVALDLAITWINRILFLKLLESQIVKYHNDDRDYAFLSPQKLNDYKDLDSLFFSVLARREDERKDDVKVKFTHVPYLNSSLFEMTEIEDKTICIDSLQDSVKIELHPKSVLNGENCPKTMKPLEYLLRFLDAYDFSNEGAEDIQEENKPLISASVLGLIFEKINGYKDGSFFTPSFITMYMCRETTGRAIIRKFNDAKGWNCQTVNDLYNKIEDIAEANVIFNSIRICDPSVGSGHFLVSALNELIYLKSELGILIDKNGKRLKDYHVTVDNDELIVSDNEGNYFIYNPKNVESQRVQETFFHEKQTIIENCLFGVDINPNSVKICQLRLWIELLKHTYYRTDTNELETLPNIDINIKCGNSLISRFDLRGDYSALSSTAQQKLRFATGEYKTQVIIYKSNNDKATKKQTREHISKIRDTFSQINNPKDADYRKWKEAENKALNHLTSIRFDNDNDAWERQLEILQAENDALREKYEQKIKTFYSNAFEWSFEFPEVLDDNGNYIGFDVVIGNPPYGTDIDDFTEIFDKFYPKTSHGFKDIYKYFFDKSLTLLKKNGILAFITPNTFLRQPRYGDLRRLLLEQSILQLVDLGEHVFEAVVPTAISIISSQQNDNVLFADLTKCENPKIAIQNMDLKIIQKQVFIETPNNLFVGNMRKKLPNESLLNDILDFKDAGINYQRINVGLSDKGNSDLSKRLLYEGEKEKDEDMEYYKGTDINSFFMAEKTNRFIRLNIKLNKNERVVLNQTYFEITPKLLWRQTAPYPIVTIDKIGIWFGRSIQAGTIKEAYKEKVCYEYLCGLLNSKYLRYLYEQNVREEGRVFPQVKLEKLKILPIVLTDNQDTIVTFVNQILSAKKENPTTDISALETEIDHLVYELYGLTEEEIKIIDGGRKLR